MQKDDTIAGGRGMRSLFDVTNDQISSMTPEEAVDLFQQLLWAEASRLGVSINNVNISRWIDVPDGGIDASVREVCAEQHSGLLRRGMTGYQIKTGGSFKPWLDSHIKRELFRTKKDSVRENLGASVRQCLDSGGAYVLVCFGHDLDYQRRRESEAIVKNHFANCGYADTAVEVLSINQLLGFLQFFPSLAKSINRLGGLDFQSHESWSRNSDMRCTFHGGAVQREFVEKIQGMLRSADSPVHIRVSGDPGIGKTRLLMEATSAEDLSPLVLYFESPVAFKGSGLLSTILTEDSTCHAILVVDECDQRESSTLWNKLKFRSPHIKLVTLWCDYEETAGPTQRLCVLALAEEELSSIIQSYGIERHRANRWTEFCSGSPRVAHIVGQNLKNNPEDIMRSPDHVAVWNRYVAGFQNLDDAEVRRRELVLQSLALFKRCGFEGPVRDESQIVGRIVENIDSDVTFQQFRRIVGDLRSRGIVKGTRTVHISPKLFHVKLWGDWWDSYGDYSNTLIGDVSQLPPDLRTWFYEMFEYAAGFEATRRIAKSKLAQNGILQTIGDLTNQETARFFSALVSADPEAALDCLKRTVGKCDREELKGFIAGRREVIWALEKMAIWQELFGDAAALLLRLAETENETWSNNASGVFAGLFTPAPSAVAPTEATPQERLPFLVEAMNSCTKEIRLLAIRACDNALESDHFSRLGSPHHQGLQRDAQLWMPVTWKELFDYYRQVWTLLRTRHEALPDDEKAKATEVILNRSQRLIRFAPLADLVVDTLEEMARKPYIKTKQLLHRIINILHMQKTLRSECRARLKRLRDRLTGDDFSSLLRRHVGMTVIEDHYDEDGNPVDTGRSNIADLARQAVSTPELLKNNFAWLLTREAENAFQFGYELAQLDADFKTLPSIMEAFLAANGGENTDLLCGYLSVVFQTKSVLWEEQLDFLARDSRINRKLPEITAKSGASDEAGLRILRLVETGVLKATDFWVLSYRSFVNHLSETVFEKIVDVLFADPSSFAASTALDLVQFRYCGRTEQVLPEALAHSVLTHPGFFHAPETGRRDQMDEYRWKVVALRFIRLNPVRSLELAETMLAHFGREGSIMEGFRPYPQSVLDEITRKYPVAMWDKLSAYLVIPPDRRSSSIASWLQGEARHYDPDETGETPTALEFIPEELIWKWIDEDVENRACYFAHSMVPRHLFRQQGSVCLAREMLARYGNLKSVSEDFGINFSGGGWSGPDSLHWARKKQMLQDFKTTEDNSMVRQWIDEQIVWFEKCIDEARVGEERENW